MQLMIANTLIATGVFLWYWGALQLFHKNRYLWKIHALGIADTVGTLFILSGALLRHGGQWNHILLAMGSVIFWGAALAFVLARLGSGQETEERL